MNASLSKLPVQVLSISGIQRGQHLERAQRSTIAEFFARRMRSAIRNSHHRAAWDVLYEDEKNMYYGQTTDTFQPGALDKLYQLPISKLEAQFPGWRSLNGEAIRVRIHATLSGHLAKRYKGSLVILTREDFSARLKDGVILAMARPSVQRKKGEPLELTFRLWLDSANGRVLNFEEIHFN